MVIVTDLELYVHRDWNDTIDNVLIPRANKGWDNLLIFDGMERIGKTKFAVTTGYVYAWKLGKKFSLDNVHFDPEEMMKFATTTRNQVIIWDEAATAGLAKNWQSETQQQILKILMMAGKYGHLWIFIVPSFFELSRYIALHRSLFLIHLYTPDLITRGYFRVFNQLEKAYIYTNLKKKMTYGKQDSFVGDYGIKNTEKILDWDAYEAKKDKAIMKVVENELPKKERKLLLLQYKVAMGFPNKVAAEALGIPYKTIQEWRNHGVRLGITADDEQRNNTLSREEEF